MSEINLLFTPEEIVKLISCCNQAIVRCEEDIRSNGNAPNVVHGFKPSDSLNKIWEIKNKLKTASISHFGSGSKSNDIHVNMDITEIIKLNGCCNSLIANNEKMIEIFGNNSNTSNTLNEEIQYVLKLKKKIKGILNQRYGSALFTVI